MALEAHMEELKQAFGLTDEDTSTSIWGRSGVCSDRRRLHPAPAVVRSRPMAAAVRSAG
jgi:hypothetical protein